MEFKQGVQWKDMHTSMWMARMVTDTVYREETGVGATITSARRTATPGGSSLHPKGRAIDVRVWGMTQHQQRRTAELIRDRLGPGFDVIVEGPAAENPAYKHRAPHIHIEYEGE